MPIFSIPAGLNLPRMPASMSFGVLRRFYSSNAESFE